MEKNATIYYSTNNAPYVKRNGEICICADDFEIRWQEEESEFCIKRKNGELLLSSKGAISYEINLSSNEKECQISTPYGVTCVGIEGRDLNYYVKDNDDTFFVKIEYTLVLGIQKDKYTLSCRGKKL